MVNVNELIYEVEKQLHRIHSSLAKDITAVDIISYINQAKDIILERFDELIEKNKSFENHLNVLEVTDKLLDKIKSNKEYDVFKLPEDYYNYLRVKVYAYNDKCIEPQAIETLSYIQKDDVSESLKDPFRTPSWYWRRGFFNISSMGIMVYHNSKYLIDSVKLSYIKYLEDVQSVTAVGGSYLKADGTTVAKMDKHLDLPRNGTLWRKIVDIAVVLIKRDLDDNFRENIDTYLFNQNVGIN